MHEYVKQHSPLQYRRHSFSGKSHQRVFTRSNDCHVLIECSFGGFGVETLSAVILSCIYDGSFCIDSVITNALLSKLFQKSQERVVA